MALLGSSRRVSSALLRATLLTPVMFALLAINLGIGIITSPPTKAVAGINEKINFQGRLLNAQGATVPDGFYNIQFKIYQDGDGLSVGNTTGSPAGTLKWTENHFNAEPGGTCGGGTPCQGVMVKNGFLSVDLGSITAFGSSVDWNQDTLWLSMNVGSTSTTCGTASTPYSGAPCSFDGEMVPMKRMTSTPYSLNSGRLGGLTADNFVKLAQGVQTEAGTNTNSIYIDKTGSGNFLKLQSSGVDALTVTQAGDITFGANADHTLSVATSGAGVAGKALTISAGAAGTDASPLTGGSLTLQGGAGGGTNGNGGNASIDGGAANGSGTNGSVLVGTTTASAVQLGRTGITTTVNGALTVTQATLLNGGLTASNGGNVAFEKGSDFSTTGSSNNVNFGTGVMFRLTGATAQTITGIAGGVNGRIITLVNAGSAAATIKNLGSSDPDKQITTGTGADITLQVGASTTLAYDSGASLWRVTAGTGAAPNSYIDNQNSVDQTANFRISGTGQANTSLLTPKLDTATGVQLDIGVTTATAIAIGRSAITTTVTGGFTQQTGAFSLTGNANSQVSTTGATSLSINSGTGGLNIGTANVANTVQIGNVANAIAQTINIGNNATASSTTNVTIGNLLGTSATTIQGGTGASAISIQQGTSGTVSIATANAGVLSIGKQGSTATFNGNLTVGASAGSGTVLTVNGATVHTTLALTDFASGGSIGSAASTVDIYTAVSIAQTTVGQTLTVPTPTANTTYGRTLYVSNVGTTGFILLGKALNPGVSATLIWSNTNGGASWTYADTDHAGMILVAASNSSAADKAAADYVATGTNDHTTINSALTAADPAGSGRKSGKVQLFAGTYTLGGSISVPNNTTLAGSGMGTLITIPNSLNVNFSAIVNSDTTTGTGVTLQDLRLDGNKTNQSASNIGMTGVEFTNMGGGSGSGVRPGAKLTNIQSNNWYLNGAGTGSFCQQGSGICLYTSSSNTITNNTIIANSSRGISIIAGANNTVANNTVQGNGVHGVSINGGTGTTITGNTVEGNGNSGIIVENAANFNTITGNSLQSNAIAGILVSSNSNVASGNKIHNNGGGTTNNGIYLTTADSNTIVGNDITDTSASSNNYAVNITDAASDTNYLADNTLGTGTINNAGTGTRFGGQDTGSTFALQPGSNISMQTPASGTIDIATANVASKTVNIGSVGSTAQDTTIHIADSSAGAQAVTIGSTNSTSSTLIQGGTSTNAISVQQGASGTISIGTLNAGIISIGKQASTTTLNGHVTIGATAGSGTLLTNNGATVNTTLVLGNFASGGAIGTAAVTVDIYTAVSVAQTTTGQTLTVPTPTANTTYGRMLYVSNVGTTGFILLGKALNPGVSATLIWANTNGGASWTYSDTDHAGVILVAASNSSAADKAAADYVALGTNDHTTINAALTAADPAGSGRKSGKVQLFAGTYTIGGSISVPNNTTLAGMGQGTLITIPNSLGADLNAVVNSDVATGTGVTVQDLKLDGNKAGQSGSFDMRGILFDGMGAGSGTSARQGGKITNVWANNWYGSPGSAGSGIVLTASLNNTVSNSVAYANSGVGIRLGSTSSNNTIVGNSTQGNGSYGIYLNGGSTNTVTGNVSQGNTTGIATISGSNNTISGNTIEGSTTSGIHLGGSASTRNLVTGNTVNNSGGSTANNGIYVSGADYNTIQSNSLSDSACTTTCHAINIVDSASDKNYLSDNRFNGSSANAAGINDIGTNTIYSNQQTNSTSSDVATGNNVSDFLFRGSSNSTTAFRLQDASSNTLLNVDTATSGGAVTITGGTGSSAVSLQTGSGGTILMGTANVSNTIQIGNTANAVTQNINIGNNNTASNTTNVTIGAGSSATAGITSIRSKDNTTITTNGVVRATFDTAGALYVGDGVTNAASVPFTISATGSATTAVTGGALTIKGGNATVGSANGGNITVSGGSGVGTGVSGLVVLTTPTYQTASSGTAQACGVNCNVTQANVDSNGVVVVNATAGSLTVTLPSPTLGSLAASYGRIVYVTAAHGSNDFTLSVNGGGVGNLIAMRANTTATMVWGPGNAGAGAWTAAGASSSTTLQAAYDNTLQSSGGAELVIGKTANTNGLTIRDSTVNPVNGALVSVQSKTAANLLSVSSNVTDYASNPGAETAGGSPTAFPSNTWAATTGATVTRNITTNNNTIATGQGSVSVATTTSAGSGVSNQIVDPTSGSAVALANNNHYNVSFSVRLPAGAVPFTDLRVLYQYDGTPANTVACAGASAQVVAQSVWTKVNCSFTAPATGTTITSANLIRIEQTAGGTARTYYVDNLSLTIAADYSLVTDGGGDVGAGIGTSGTTWNAATAGGAGGTITQDLTDGQAASSSVKIASNPATAHSGIRNKLSVSPLVSTLYRVTVYAKATASFTDFKVRYSATGSQASGSSGYIDCVDYNTQNISTSLWTKVTCYITTDATSPTTPYIYFVQTAATAHQFSVDTASMTLASASTPNVQIGSGANGGPTTLFTLDRGASAPIAGDNEALLGSMYYDTTLGKLQCYEADGWGACGSSPDVIVTLSPEYTNAVMHGTGVGTLTSDFCADDLNINDGTGSPAQPTICVDTSGQAFNFYKWTSPQASAQTYSVYVTYQLPSTFKAFQSGQTNIIGKTDSANSTVRYKVFKKTNSALTQCGTGFVSVSTGVQTNWQTGTASGAADPSTCSFAATNSIVFQIEVTSSSNANAYVGNLNFTFSNN